MKQTKPFQVGYIDVDSGDNVYAYFPNWKEADNFVKLYQRNAIPAWHVEYICPHTATIRSWCCQVFTNHLVNDCTENRSGV